MLEVKATAADWCRLTSEPEKQAEFANDFYFRECWPDFLEVWGVDPHLRLQSVALLCAKTDAVVARRLRPMLQYAVERGFRPIGVERTEFSRHSMREIWRYDWHVYPVDRLDFSTLWFSACPTLTFILRDIQPIPGIPASVRLSDLKGGPVLALRRPGDMRSVLAPPNRILNFVHIPDEPADIVRELGILFERTRRTRLLSRLAADFEVDRSDQILAAIEAIEAEVPPHDLDVQASLRRLQAAGATTECGTKRLAAALKDEEKLGWDQILDLVDIRCPRTDRWDVICLASWLIQPERPSVAGLLPAGNLQAWQKRKVT